MSQHQALILNPQVAPIGVAFVMMTIGPGVVRLFKAMTAVITCLPCAGQHKFAPNWLTNSYIVRAVADTPTGPYIYAEDIVSQRGAEHWDGLMAHNPTIHQLPAGSPWGRYALFYTGSTYDGGVPTASITGEDPRRNQARANQLIGVLTAHSINGPWTRREQPILGPRPGKWDGMMVTNPAAVIHDDGSILLYYKAVPNQTAKMAYGVARAEALDAPFERLRDDPLFGGSDDSPNYEDAYVWHQDGRYHMIFNDIHGYFTGEDHAGGYACSKDGIDWTPGGKAYTRKVTWSDGTQTYQGSLERPQLLLENGQPRYLFAATADGPGGYSKADNTWNMVLPLQPTVMA